MGLDWVLQKRKARAGHEARFAELEDLFECMRKDYVRPSEALEEEYENVSITCFEVIGAPRIGIDDEATEFFRTEVYAPARRETLEQAPKARADSLKTFEEALAENYGKYVVELAKESGGLAAISGIAVSNLDFRGKVVAMCPLLPESLRNEAFQDHNAEQCVTYAKALAESIDDPSEYDPKHFREIKSVESAVKWLRFWGSRGFGYFAWA